MSQLAAVLGVAVSDCRERSRTPKLFGISRRQLDFTKSYWQKRI